MGSEWEQHIVAELDSALNKWIDSIPEHRTFSPYHFHIRHFASRITYIYIYLYPYPRISHRPTSSLITNFSLTPHCTVHWDPSREDPTFFRQSAVLYCTYYHVQILVHRPFIPSPRKPSPLSFPSLAICTNAARSCSHVVEVGLRKNLPMPVGYFQVRFWPVIAAAEWRNMVLISALQRAMYDRSRRLWQGSYCC